MLSQKCIRSNSVEKQSQIYNINNMINITNIYLSDLSHCMYLSDCTVNIQSSYVFTHLKHLMQLTRHYVFCSFPFDKIRRFDGQKLGLLATR